MVMTEAPEGFWIQTKTVWVPCWKNPSIHIETKMSEKFNICKMFPVARVNKTESTAENVFILIEKIDCH